MRILAAALLLILPTTASGMVLDPSGPWTCSIGATTFTLGIDGDAYDLTGTGHGGALRPDDRRLIYTVDGPLASDRGVAALLYHLEDGREHLNLFADGDATTPVGDCTRT